MHVSTLDGVSVGEFNVVIILLRSSFVKQAITRIFGAWMLINFYFQTAIEYWPEIEANSNSIFQSTSIQKYPIIILNVDISSFVTKGSHYFDMATFSCQVQGSHLMGRKELQSKSCTNPLIFHPKDLVSKVILQCHL